ncbi:MAG: DUF5134 domain-containing protein [Mycobacterium sp.]
MIDDLLLRWIVTALFVLSAAECGSAMVAQRRPWTSFISHGLHLVMAVAMAVMAWPRGAQLPTTALMVFFLLATAWFMSMAVVVANTTSQQLVRSYHAAMMLAMTWMYAVMNGQILPGESREHDQITPPGPGMPGMDMPGMETQGSNTPEWITAINWFWMVGFAVAALFWVWRYVVERKQGASSLCSHNLGIACQAMMAIGMAIMFGVML